MLISHDADMKMKLR